MLATKGASALHVPYLVEDADEQEVDVTVGLGRAKSWGNVILGVVEPAGAHFEGFNFKWCIKSRVGTSWGLSPELKAFIQQHVLACQRPVVHSETVFFYNPGSGLVPIYVSCDGAKGAKNHEVSR